MMNKSDFPYWVALTQVERWGNVKVNGLIETIVHEEKLMLEEFFQLSENEWREKFKLSPTDCTNLKAAKDELPNYSFLSEDLLSQGFEIIPITSSEYSPTLKENLKPSQAPPLLYVKGNTKLLHEDSIAIVGSRDASETALRFTDNITRLASQEYKVIVSGFAKGVDKQALDSSLQYKGHSIIVLPQGIMTFGSGIKKYYSQIVEGDVLVLSTFFPKAPWSAQLAMARNPVIYGLAKEIYVAESQNKGGTWSGVIDGLRKGRTIYVRNPEPDENSANKMLMGKGAIAVNFDGNPLSAIPTEDEREHPTRARSNKQKRKKSDQENLFE